MKIKIKWSLVFKVIVIFILVNNVSWKESEYSTISALLLVVCGCGMIVAEQFEKLDRNK